MQNDLQASEVKRGMAVWFFQHPKDNLPTMQTTVERVDEDLRGRASITAKGVGEFPIYHFKMARPLPETYSSSAPLQDCDDLFKRLRF